MCNASFLNKYRLKKHVDSIHLGKPVKCSLCDKVAPNESALVILTSATDLNSSLTIYAYRHVIWEAFTWHKASSVICARKHSRQLLHWRWFEPIYLTWNLKLIVTFPIIQDHIATHTGEKLYKCSFCPEAFIWRPNMYSHQKRAHPEQWQIEKAKGRKRPSI